MPLCPSLKSVCTGLLELPDARVPNNSSAAGMFSQIDVLSAPGAGLRHLDFTIPSSMFQSYLDDGNSSSVQMEPVPSPLNTPQCFVRTYGSEPEMLVPYYQRPCIAI